MACSESSQQNEDLISNVPDTVTDQILENLPIHMIARTSVLSKQWRRTWLSRKNLVFDYIFWRLLENEDGFFDWQKWSRVISEILLHHVGPVHDFYLYFPFVQDCMNHSQWISFLSKNGVRKITMINLNERVDMTSYIFSCSEIVHLQLRCFNFVPPSPDFSGFPNLVYLELDDIVFTEQNFLSSLIENCRKLATFKLFRWSGMDHIVIDAPSLQTLILQGSFESLAFRNVGSLKSISICLLELTEKFKTTETTDAINLLASSCELQAIEFEGSMCKFYAAGDIIGSSPVTFNHVDKLCLNDLNLSEVGVFPYLLTMIQYCPNITKLDISFRPGENVGEPIVDYNYNSKLDRLLEVNIQDITGSIEELKFIRYLLANSTVLENLFFKTSIYDTEAELKLSRTLTRFPRASPKASVVCLPK